MAIVVGSFCRVKKDAWREWCIRNSKEETPPPEQPVISMPSHGPYDGYAMLAFPFWWWRLDELEVL